MNNAQSHQFDTKFPTMLNNSDADANPLIPLCQNMENVDRDTEFLDAVADAAETAGCHFMFEIPGSLFEQPGFRAAAVLYDRGDFTGEKVFILYSQEHGAIQVVGETEVSEQALKFVDSYANVLTCLNQLETCDQLH